MRESTKRWLRKAQGDFRTMNREFKADPDPNYDAVCFHAQQCAEKTIKAFLIDQDVEFPKSHDLRSLIRLSYSRHAEWQQLEQEAYQLSAHAVETRYPGEDQTKEDAEDAIRICRKIRKAVLATFDHPDQLRLE